MRDEASGRDSSLSPHPFIIGSVTVQTPTPAATEQGPSFTLNDLLIYAAKQQASDLHLKPMRPPLVRIHGKLVPIKTEPLKPADLEKMLLPILNRPQREKFDTVQSVDFGYGVPGVARFRANLYMQRGTVGAVFRRIPIQILGIDALELPLAIRDLSHIPDGLVLVHPGTESDFLAPLPIGVIPGLGPKTEERLRLMGVRTVGDLAGHETQRLIQALGPGGAMLQRLADGRDRSPVDGSRPAKTLSAETTFEQDVTEVDQLEAALRELVDRVAERLRADGVRARTVYVKLKLPDFRQVSRQVSRTSPTDDADAIFRAARTALEKSHVESRPVRLIGVGLSGLVHPQPDLQLNLFD